VRPRPGGELDQTAEEKRLLAFRTSPPLARRVELDLSRSPTWFAPCNCAEVRRGLRGGSCAADLSRVLRSRSSAISHLAPAGQPATDGRGGRAMNLGGDARSDCRLRREARELLQDMEDRLPDWSRPDRDRERRVPRRPHDQGPPACSMTIVRFTHVLERVDRRSGNRRLGLVGCTAPCVDHLSPDHAVARVGGPRPGRGGPLLADLRVYLGEPERTAVGPPNPCAQAIPPWSGRPPTASDLRFGKDCLRNGMDRCPSSVTCPPRQGRDHDADDLMPRLSTGPGTCYPTSGSPSDRGVGGTVRALDSWPPSDIRVLGPTT
jgi:hypothetical protein